MRFSEHEGWGKAFPWNYPLPPPPPRMKLWAGFREGESQEVVERTKLIFPKRAGRIKAEPPNSSPSYSTQLTLQLLLLEFRGHISNIRLLQDLPGHFYGWHWLIELNEPVDKVHSV